MHMAHQAGMGVGVVLLVIVVVSAVFVGYHFYTRSVKPFHFHYFKVTFMNIWMCVCLVG